ncbi:hypothetical protein BV898_02605 [Hypsibius exemplaris]|uniref:Protein sleepless n=1 Tax=Hypsibius exemplaris TaxID=2072580 RepID=A0A1W0X7V4_HYPEX|nr:hypothetical protein BV898_02605 [Hypsibius exemplaris]
MWTNFRLNLAAAAALFLIFLSAAEALRCYSCNSRNQENCVDLSEQCRKNIDCRSDFIGHCSQMENTCAVVYGPGNQVWRGCYSDPKRATVSNDQTCKDKDGLRTCLCQVDMCNASAKISGLSAISTLSLIICVFFVAL